MKQQGINKLKLTTMTITAKEIFELECTELNPETKYYTSSLSKTNDTMSNYQREHMLKFVEPNSLAEKILKSGQTFFTAKQMWVIAFNLAKNPLYIKDREEYYDRIKAEIADDLDD